jgi:uncharacterized protein (TIGR03643 family)
MKRAGRCGLPFFFRPRDVLSWLPAPAVDILVKHQLTTAQSSAIVHLAWQDRVTFEEIQKLTGMGEGVVIDIMRRELKPGSFRAWRKRMHGRVTKHRKLLKQTLAGSRS